MVSGDTTIVGYKCKKAICNFRGRKWTAWYTLDIPISEGPWKLDGLPGMIFKAIDSLNQFSFECIGVKVNVNVPMTVQLKKLIMSTRARIRKLKILKESNWKAYEKIVGLDKVIASEGTYPSMVACLLEKY